MQAVSATWPQLVEGLRHGAGLDIVVGIEIPTRQLFLSPRPWPAAALPAGVSTYPFLAPHGTGIQGVTVELADDRTSRVGSVTCEVLVVTERAGAALGATVLDILLTLEQQPATVWLLLQGGLLPQAQEKLILLAGRITGLRLARGVLTFEVVDGAQADHRDIALSLGASVFAGSPLESHGQALPLVFGATYGLQPVLVEGAAQGTLATAVGTTETVLDLFEMAAPFPSAAQLLLGAEVVSYTGRLITAQSDGTPVLRLTGLARSTPGPHPIGTPVLVSPVRYRYFIGFGIPALQLIAVRTAAGPATSGYTFVTHVPGLPEGAAAIDFDAEQDGLQVDVEPVPPAPLPPLVNGSFETGALAPWTAAAGTTAVLRSGNASAGQYAIELRNVTPNAPGALWQDVPTTTGVRQTVHLAWQTPLGQDNLVPNGFFLAPVMAPWTATLRGSPLPSVEYTPAAADADHGQIAVHSTVIPQQGFRTLATPLSQVTIDAVLQVADVVLIPGVPHSIDVRVTAWVFHQQAVPPILGLASGENFQPGQGVPTSHSIVSGYGIAGAAVRLTVQLVPADDTETLSWYLTEPSGTRVIGPAEHRIAASQQTFVPMTTTYRLVIALRGSYQGNPGPMLLSSAVISQSTLPILGQAFLQLGTPEHPTAYLDEGLAPSTRWTTASYTFVPSAPTTRLTLRGTTALGPAAVRFDDVRFLPPGRNPVTIMAGIFQRFLPHLRLDTASVERATYARQAWTFGGYIPDVGSTDTLLQQLARQAACTVFKDVTGAYQIVADDPGRAPTLRLDGRRDVYASQVTLTWDDIANVYTDVYVWYQRTMQQATVSPAAQYAAVVFATPDTTNSTHPELQIICSLAAGSLQIRQRLDIYADFLTEPRTADLLLQHLVHVGGTLRRQIDLGVTACALPVMQTDIVQLAHPLATQGALWSGEVRRRSVVFSASAPGLMVRLSLREFGSIRGVSETWEAPPVPLSTPRVQEPWDDLTAQRLLLETWEEVEPEPEPEPGTGTFPFAAYVAELLDTYDAPGVLVAATQMRPGDPVPVDGAFWRTDSMTPAADDPWAPIETLSGGVQGTTLGLGDFTAAFGGQLSVVGTLRAEIGTPPSTLWTLGILADHTTPAYRDEIAAVLELPSEVSVSSLLEYTHGGTGVRYMLLGTTEGAIYRWNRVSGDLEQVYTSDGGKVQILRRISEIVPGPTYEAWIEHPDGLIIVRASYPDFTWSPYTYANLTGTRCSTRAVVYSLDTYVMVATGNETGDRIDVWNLTHWSTVGAELLHTFVCGPTTSTPLQRPGPLAVRTGGRNATHPYCYLGRISLDTTPMLELWGFDSAADPQWQLLQNYAYVPWHDPTAGLDMNQGITELFVTRTSQTLYVATGTPGGPRPLPPGARIYHYTPGEEIWDSAPWFFHSAFPPPTNYCYGLLGVAPTQVGLAGGYQPGSFWANHTAAPAWVFRNANVASGLWDTGLTIAGGGWGAALGMYNGQAYVAVRPAAPPHPQPWQLWRLEPTASGPGNATMVTPLKTFAENVRAMQEYNGMGDGNWLYIGNDTDNDILRWNGTTLEAVPTAFGAAGQYVKHFFVMEDQATQEPAFYMALDGGPANGGASLCRLVRDPTLRFVQVWSFPGNFISEVALLGTIHLLAVGNTAGTHIQIVRLTSTDASVVGESIFLFDGLSGQRPGALAVYNARLYLGRLSTSATPMLELWGSTNGTSWSLEVDFATYVAGDDTPDTNTGITALGRARGKFYAATGTLLAGPVLGIRVYSLPAVEAVISSDTPPNR